MNRAEIAVPDEPMNLPRVLGITPFEIPDCRLVMALEDAGAIGVLDLGHQKERALSALDRLVQRRYNPVWVRLPEHADWLPSEIPQQVSTVVLTPEREIHDWTRTHSVVVQVTSTAEAEQALNAEISGLIVKGNESGGYVGDEGTFILLQRVLGLPNPRGIPVWAQGGIGFHSAAAAVAGGAHGIVLDGQLALLSESSLPAEVRKAIESMDGSETRLIGNYRVYANPSLATAGIEDLDAAELRERLGACDLNRDFLPVGQDGALSAVLTAQESNAEAVVYQLHQAIAGHIRQAKHLSPLAPGSRWARFHQCKYPVVQGPMTRVSDTAAFADAVSTAGGFPFLALSLMRPPKVRELFRETRKRLNDRPWGVGILGFAPAELRRAQLDLCLEYRPSAVIIAGGKPAQAHLLEDAGIQTYLHVPSPGMLKLFLKEGIRSFVFEGRECGGHVGPRTSFLLWEQQIECLLEFDRCEDYDILFAGGIHDARSAAMVGVMAAPLCSRGAKIGLLMGTAYITTSEAVRAGAILPNYQEVVISVDETTLLETAPGHATRCLKTPFVETFVKEKERLISSSESSEKVWQQLEQLNVGRLRIATKGVRRDGEKLVDVDETSQLNDGLYLIGQAAALKKQVLTLADLHATVSTAGTQWIASLEVPVPERDRHDRDIAIIGMACVYPGAPDLDSFWANIISNKDVITEVPPERWHSETYFDPESRDGDKTPSKWGGIYRSGTIQST